MLDLAECISYVLLCNCKHNITSLSLLVGTIVHGSLCIAIISYESSSLLSVLGFQKYFINTSGLFCLVWGFTSQLTTTASSHNHAIFHGQTNRPWAGYRPPPPRGIFVHYDFLKLHYIRHKIKDVSPLRVAALTFNITLFTLPPKIALNVPDNVSTMTCSFIFACWHRFMNFL